MDIESQEKIESVLEEFTGTVFFVSHDRYFIKKLANKIFVLEKRELICYEGDYEYYLDKCQKQNLNQEIGEDLGDITDNINRLECELAFLSGRLNEILDEEEKAELDRKFFLAAKKLKEYRRLLGK